MAPTTLESIQEIAKIKLGLLPHEKLCGPTLDVSMYGELFLVYWFSSSVIGRKCVTYIYLCKASMKNRMCSNRYTYTPSKGLLDLLRIGIEDICINDADEMYTVWGRNRYSVVILKTISGFDVDWANHTRL